MLKALPSSRQLALLGGLLLAMGAISYLARVFPRFPGDLEAFQRLQGLHTPWLDRVASAIAWLASTWVAVASIIILSLAFLVARRAGAGLMVFLALPLEGLGLGVKGLVSRPRPPGELLSGPSATDSFPSGHAIHAILLFGLLIYLVGLLVRPLWLRYALQGLLSLLIVGVGLSRVYLGLHWPSDVLGSYLYGGLGLLGLRWAYQRLLYRASITFP